MGRAYRLSPNRPTAAARQPRAPTARVRDSSLVSTKHSFTASSASARVQMAAPTLAHVACVRNSNWVSTEHAFTTSNASVCVRMANLTLAAAFSKHFRESGKISAHYLINYSL